MHNLEFYTQTLELIDKIVNLPAGCSVDTKNILNVLKQIVTQNYALMDILRKMAKALNIDGQLPADF
ncbi:hypothetical protein ES708_04057 [subsurface metagenome]